MLWIHTRLELQNTNKDIKKETQQEPPKIISDKYPMSYQSQLGLIKFIADIEISS